MVVPHPEQVPRSRVDGCADDELDSVVAMKYPFVVRASGSCGDSAGAISFSDTLIIVVYLSFYYIFHITFLGVDVRQKIGGLTCKPW